MSTAKVPQFKNPYINISVKCAGSGCMQVRTESNHWFAITQAGTQMSIEPFVDRFVVDPTVLPACGVDCATKIISTHLSGLQEKS